MIDTNNLNGKQRELLGKLGEQKHIPSLLNFCLDSNIDFNFVKGFLLSGLLNGYVKLNEINDIRFLPTKKGVDYGSVPGYRLVKLLEQGVTSVLKIKEELEEHYSIEYGALRKEKTVDTTVKDEIPNIVLLQDESIQKFDERQQIFSTVLRNSVLSNISVEHLDWLIKQGLIIKKVSSDYEVDILPTIQQIVIKPVITNLTSELIISGKWQEVEFKSYNIHDDVLNPPFGRPCILTKCIDKIRSVFLEMGFEEMSGNVVESCFWNFDVLFTAQDHPAREIQDTFYVSVPIDDPVLRNTILVEQVQKVHEKGYGDNWSFEKAQQAVLRTHTTASTARKLYQLKGREGKFFSVDRVFRNENVDKTHLAEFHQIEGVVISPELSIRSLMGYLSFFYQQLGFKQLKFKSTYNPYTEPSLEVYAYDKNRDSFLEVGNSGMFRPEVLAPLGYAGQSTVAWGLGLERIAMILFGLDKLSNILGPSMSLEIV